MKVLFLDIDGVVNNKDTYTKDPKCHFPLDAYMAFLVGRIQMSTDCNVVLSSSWRHHPESVVEIEKRIVKLFDKTGEYPYDTNERRGCEIQQWLDAHPEVTKYAILDDTDEFLPDQQKNYFKTTFLEGLTTDIAEAVIRHLKGNKQSR